MKLRKGFAILLICAVVVSAISSGATATGPSEQMETLSVWATGRFNMEIAGKTIVRADTSFPLEAGESVTIKASYSPFSASVDFGIVDSDGSFHYLNVTGGSIDEAITVIERGTYTLAVRNNSTGTISVSGYVNY